MPLIPVPGELRCALTGALLASPVVASDGFSYEYGALHNWIETFDGKQPVSPVTKQPLAKIPRMTHYWTDNDYLVANDKIKPTIQKFRSSILKEADLRMAIETGDTKLLQSKPFIDPLRNFLGLALFGRCPDRPQLYPLHVAVSVGQLESLRYLLNDCKMDATGTDGHRNSLLHAIMSQLSLHSTDAAGTTAEMVNFLINDCKLQVNATNAAGRTPLLQTLLQTLLQAYAVTPKLIAAVQALLNAGADPAIVSADATVLRGRLTVDLAKLLVKHGAAVPAVLNHISTDGETFLNRPYSADDFGLFEYYLSLLSDPSKRIETVRRVSKTGRSVLHRAVVCPDIVRLLLTAPYSLDPAAITTEGATVLHELVDRQPPNAYDSTVMKQTLKLLLATGKIDIDAQNSRGRTAVVCSVLLHNDLVTAMALVEAGADPTIKDDTERSAIDYWPVESEGCLKELQKLLTLAANFRRTKSVGSKQDTKTVGSAAAASDSKSVETAATGSESNSKRHADSAIGSRRRQHKRTDGSAAAAASVSASAAASADDD